MRQGSIVGLKKLKHVYYVYHCVIFNLIGCFFLVIFFSVTFFPVSCTGQDILSLSLSLPLSKKNKNKTTYEHMHSKLRQVTYSF